MADPYDTPETKEEKGISFVSLCKDFINYYKVFEEDPGLSNYNGVDTCYVTFGISGAGKSTTLARLLSRMSAIDFWEKIQNPNADEEVEISKITIGHTANSTTVVPRVYSIGSLSVCDMPGFAETDPKKKVSIDILQKIFLTRVPNSTLLIVADVALIQDTKVERLLQHYHKALQNLLGDQYDSAVEHFYFVFTKNHAENLSSRQVKLEMDSKALEIADSDLSAMRFLKRSARCNVLVDLTQDDGETLLRKIKNMIEDDHAKKKGREKETKFRVQQVQASENLLNRLAIRNLGMIRKQQFAFTDTHNALVIDLAKLKDAINYETDLVKADRDQALKRHQAVKNQQVQILQELADYAPTHVRITKDIDEMEAVVAVREKQEELLADHFEIAEFITYRCDVSKQGTGMGKNKHSIHLNANIEGDGSIDTFVLVMDYETADSTLRKFIGRGSSLLPKKLSDLKKIDLASVIYNGHKNINTCKAEIAARDGALNLKISYPSRFKVYIYSSTPFRVLSYYDDLKESFETAKAQDVQKIAHFQQELDDLEESKGRNEKKLRELKEDLAKAIEEIGRAVDTASGKRQQHEKQCSDFISTVIDLEQNVATSKDDERLALVSKVADIFRLNKIEANLAELLTETQAAFGPIEREIKFLIEEVKRFANDNSEMLESLQAVNFSENGDGSSPTKA